MRMTLKLKMALMGAGVALALMILGGLTIWSNHVVEYDATVLTTRNAQLHLLKDMRFAQNRLLLVAMDSIIDRAEGGYKPDT
jgi:hypothetical protein